MSSEDEVERLGGLAATEEAVEFQNLRASVGEDRVLQLEQLLAECEQDRAARLDNMNELERLLRESEQARAAYELVVQRQAAQLFSIRHLRVLRFAKRTAALPYQLGRRIYQALGREHR